jgi:hypothetical protein
LSAFALQLYFSKSLLVDIMAVPLPLSRQHNITFVDTAIGKALGLPPPYVRKIDLVDGRREVPMKILCLGYSRTGTLSLLTALKMLGYNPYHMVEAAKNADIDMPCWIEGLEAKFHGKGKPWGREEFDILTGKFDVGQPGRTTRVWQLTLNRLSLTFPQFCLWRR